MIRNRQSPSSLITSIAVSLIIAFTSIPLIPVLSYSADSVNETRAYSHAEELYNSGNYLIAQKQFNGFINSYPNSEMVGRAYLYIARCGISSGEMEEAIRTYMLIIESNFNRDTKIDAIRAMGKINSIQVKKYLENLLSTSDIKIRAVVVETLGTIGNKSTSSKMIQALEKEREPDIQEKLLSSISNLSKNLLSFNTLTTLFKAGTEDLKINIVKFMSTIKKNYIVKFLQEQLNTSSSGLKPYIIWSLARIDPYLYGIRLEGTLVKENNSWWLLQNKSGVRYELSKPDNNENSNNEELEKYINKNIILFGGKYKGRILYTEIYQK